MLNKLEYQVIDNIAVGISIFSYENSSLKLLGINKKLHELFGIKQDNIDFYNNHFNSFIYFKDKKIIENLIKDSQNNIINLKTILQIYNYNTNNYEYCEVEINSDITNNKSKKLYLTFHNHTNESKKIDKILNFVVQNEFDYLVRADYKKNEYLVYFNDFEEINNLKKKATFTLDQFKKLIAKDIINATGSIDEKNITLKNIFRNLKKTGSFKKFYKISDEKKGTRIKEIKISNINLKKGIFYIVKRDVTDIYTENEKKNKALKEALTLAENANKTKTTFLSTMSHDIKTPMNAIIGMTNLTYDLIGIDNIQVKENLDIIKSSSETLLNIINEVLAMNRINSGKFKFKLQEFRLTTLSKNIFDSFKPMLNSKNQKLHCNFKIRHNYLLGDCENMKKVASILIENAIKYSPVNGKINVFIEEIESKGKKGFANFRVEIKDNGIGILSEDVDKIFDPFFRGNNVGHEKGTGLGLCLAKGILNLRGSDLKVKTEPGKGSTFIIEISLKINENFKNKYNFSIKNFKSTDENLSLNKEKVLIIEDNEINRLIVRKNLEKYNLIVEEAINGKEGYEKFITSPKDYYSLIIMDLKMPVLDGIECSKKIRKSQHKNNDIPILALSANTFSQDITKCFEAGMNDYMPKPIDPSFLKTTIAKHIK